MIYFIVNSKSKSGNAAKTWIRVREVLRKEQVLFKAFETKYRGHAAALAEKLSGLPENEIQIVVVGGDGTVNEVINGIKNFDRVVLGVIPTGSGNDFARGLGISGTPEKCIYRILEGSGTKRLDLGRVSWSGCEKPRYFAISSGIGMDAIVCKKALKSKLKDRLNSLHMGKLTYLILTLQTLFSMKTSHVYVRYQGVAVCKNRAGYLEIGNVKQKSYNKLIFAAAMNLRAEGGGIPMAPKADAGDGRLSMCIAHGVPKWRTFFVLPFLVLAKHEKLKCFDVTDFKKCDMHTDAPVVLHADGEYCGYVTDVHFECAAGILRIIK